MGSISQLSDTHYKVGTEDLEYYGELEWEDPTVVLPKVSERNVELPWGYRQFKLASIFGEQILEVGNTLTHFYPDKVKTGVTHTVVDQFELNSGSINVDILQYKPENQYSTIISLSTYEHIGRPDYAPENFPYKASDALSYTLEHLLAPGGVMYFTMPLGYHSVFETDVYNSLSAWKSLDTLVRVDEQNHWEEQHVDQFNHTDFKYASPFPYANAVAFVKYEKSL